jgi:hypothetical protein
MLTKLGTYLVLKGIWNPIDYQGQGVKCLDEGIRHALRCPGYTTVVMLYLSSCLRHFYYCRVGYIIPESQLIHQHDALFSFFIILVFKRNVIPYTAENLKVVWYEVLYRYDGGPIA